MVWGVRLRGLGFRVWDLGCKALGFRVWGLGGFRVQGFGFHKGIGFIAASPGSVKA